MDHNTLFHYAYIYTLLLTCCEEILSFNKDHGQAHIKFDMLFYLSQSGTKWYYMYIGHSIKLSF